jgi:hypothetical protein
VIRAIRVAARVRPAKKELLSTLEGYGESR